MSETPSIDMLAETPVNELFSQFDGILAGLSAVKTQINNLQQQIKQVEKTMKRQMKGLQKEAHKNKSKGIRKPSGFATPSKVTKELCEFMNKEDGTEIARTEVTKALVAYIKSHKLENATNSQIITPDTKLKYLLGVCDGDELTYFNIQKYMNKHFVKNTIAAP
jgi:chromatin remodeling complex protein RSC6